MDSTIKIKTRIELYGGYILFEISITNESSHIINDVTLDLLYEKNILHIFKYEPNDIARDEIIILGDIYEGETKSVIIYFYPKSCTKSTSINCHVLYQSYQGKAAYKLLEHKEVNVICPSIKTDSDINTEMLRKLIKVLPNKGSRIFEVQNEFDTKKLVYIARKVIEKHKFKFVCTLYTREKTNYEIWYYGKAKISTDEIIIKLSVLSEDKTLQLIVATKNEDVLTGLLAEFGSKFEDEIKKNDSDKDKVTKININWFKTHQISLIDQFNVGDNCDVSIMVNKRDMNANGFNASNLIRDNDNSICPVCLNDIDLVNKSVLCSGCGIAFCQTCEKWFRENKSHGEKTLCENCFVEEQEVIRIQREETERKAQEEAETKKRAEIEKKLLQEEISRKESEERERKQKEKEIQKERYEKTVKWLEQKRVTVISNSIGMQFVFIPPGEFNMGSNESYSAKPAHKVKISKPFYLGKYPVTQREWKAVMGSNPSYYRGNNHPVERVSWNDVQEFVKKLNEKEDAYKYRLPSEAEWEYTCRAGTTSKYSFGEGESILDEYVWYTKNSQNETHPIGQKKPNVWGLYDMHGNIWEWVQDEWHDDYSGAPTDGNAWETGNCSKRVEKGGGWFSCASHCQSSFRDKDHSQYKSDDIGFRLLMECNSDEIEKINTVLNIFNEPTKNQIKGSIHEDFSKNEHKAADIKPETLVCDSIEMEFVLIPSGEFEMGSNESIDEKPIHKVKTCKPFYLGKYPVTQKQWLSLMGYNPSYFKGDNRPVERVSWNDAQQFIKKMNEKESTDKYRLPSEAEWEYVCRAGTTTDYSFDDKHSNLVEYSWKYEKPERETHQVGQKKSNPWGLYDLHDNVCEWVQDKWHDSYEGAPDDCSAWEDEKSPYRICRGGSWRSFAWSRRSAARHRNVPDCHNSDIGFRVLRKL